MNKIQFSVIVPVYNEQETLQETITELKEINQQTNRQNEFIFVNDGSIDQSGEILNAIQDPNFIVINHAQNQGYGASIKAGIRKSKYDVIVISDADGTYPNKRVIELVHEFYQDRCDMVVGSRTGKHVKIPLLRKPAKWLINQLASYLAGMKIPDLNSGLRVMNKHVLIKFMKILPDGFSFTTTISLAMLTNDYQVKYIPIDYYERGGRSKIRPIRDTLNFFQLIIRTVIYFDPLKIFLPMSIFLFFIGFILLLYRIFVAQVFITTIIILFIASFQILAIGMLADLIDKRMK